MNPGPTVYETVGPVTSELRDRAKRLCVAIAAGAPVAVSDMEALARAALMSSDAGRLALGVLEGDSALRLTRAGQLAIAILSTPVGPSAASVSEDNTDASAPSNVVSITRRAP